MAPQQDPDTTPENTEVNSPDTNTTSVSDSSPRETSSQDMSPTRDFSTDTKEVPLEVDRTGFVAEPSLESDMTAINNEFPAIEQPAAVVVPPKKSKKKLLLIVAAAVATVLIGGAGVFAFWYNTPDKSVADAFARTLTASSAKTKGVLSYESSDSDTADIKWAFDMSMNDSTFGANSVLDIMYGGKTLAVKSDIVLSKDAAAIKMSNFNDVLQAFLDEAGMSDTDMYDGLVQKIDNKWVVITKDDLKEFGEDQESDKKLTCAQDKLIAFRTNKVQQNEVSDVYKNNRFIVASPSKGTETINGKLSNRYELTIDEEKAKTFSEKITETSIFKDVDTCYEGELKKEYDQNKDEVTGDVESDSTSKVELWVDTITHNPTKFKLTAAQDGDTVTLESTVELNSAPQITVPTADTTLKDLQDELQDIQQSFYDDSSLYEDDLESPVLGIQSFRR